MSVKIRELLKSHGFEGVGSLLTEWNIWPNGVMDTQTFRKVEAAAFDLSALIYLQDCPPDISTFYRGDTHAWGGLFDQKGIPYKAYYAFKAFRMLLDTPIRVFSDGSNNKGFAVIAGVSPDNQSTTILISNYDCEFNSYDINLLNLPWKEDQVNCEVYILDSNHDLELVRTIVKKLNHQVFQYSKASRHPQSI